MKKETAVDWLYDNLNKCFDKFDNGEYSYTDFVNASKEIRKQAKAMEKEQHGQTWDDAITAFKERGFVESRAICDFDEYYQSTYGTNSN